ncbi:MAG: hypothetical protein OGMRLDGQ_001855 [Candidatus Fervidibacter sp.]|jgi:hypothetical protein
MALQQLTLGLPQESIGSMYRRGGVVIYNADVMTLYEKWEPPVVIISDGAYGLNLFPGDPPTVEELVAWYEPHVKAWSEKSTPQTTLWFWNTELGWATVHPLLVQHGWRFVNCHIWDKGIAHVAGNSNTQVLRKFPVVTEVCVQYVREFKVNGLSLQEWLRQEWERTGLPLRVANEACGVKNAATRKYLTKDHLWYFPPPDVFERMVNYANRFGRPEGRPYFSLDGVKPLSGAEWAKLRPKFYCKVGVTNVWRVPPLHSKERIRIGNKSFHPNQKPLELMELIIEASSDPGDLIWEPFGGLCTAALAAYRLKRRCVSAEIQREFYEMAVRRLQNA